jgi:hypothetical protein
VKFAAKELNGAVAGNAGHTSAGVDKVTSANCFGICKSSHRLSKVQSEARLRVAACGITPHSVKPAEMPGGNSKWGAHLTVRDMPDGTNTRQKPMKRSSPERPAQATTPAPVPAQHQRKIVNRDLSKLRRWTVDGRNDAFGNLLPLKCHMAQLSDFQDEETPTQHHGKSLGVKVEQTPKRCPKVAGERVQHSWARAKGFHRHLPLSEKCRKQNSMRPCQDVLIQNLFSPQRDSRCSAGLLMNAQQPATRWTIMKMKLVIRMRKRMAGKQEIHS